MSRFCHVRYCIMIIIIIIILCEFFIRALTDSLLLEFEREQVPQVSRTLLSILADLNAVVWVVSARSPISNSSNLLPKPQGIVLSLAMTIGITSTHMFRSFFLALWQVLSTCLSFRFLWVSLCTQPGRQSLQYVRSSHSLLSITSSSGLVAEIKKPFYISMSQRILCLILLEGFWFVHILFLQW